MEDIKKVVCLGRSKTSGGRGFHIFCQVNLKKREKGIELSIIGVEGPLPSGNCLGDCGQINMSSDWTKSNYIFTPNFVEGWTYKKLVEFKAIWDRWHLNGMIAECKHQKALGWKYEEHHAKRDKLFGSEWLAKKASIKFLRFIHKYTLFYTPQFTGDKCPTCGYKIGSKWLFEKLPDDVLKFVKGLKNTSNKYAWV